MDISNLIPWDAKRYEEKEINNILTTYENLGYIEFLGEVSHCTGCQGFSSPDRPYNILANDIGKMGATVNDRCHELSLRSRKFIELLHSMRSANATSEMTDEEMAESLYQQLFGKEWNQFGGYGEGVSIGLNPWTDYFLSKWNEQRDRCGILGIEKDWFPLNSTIEVRSIFDYQYHEGIRSKRSHTYRNFWNKLREEYPLTGHDGYLTYSREMISRFNIVFTNSMACIKHGEKRSGDDEVILRAAENCKRHTMRQIELLRPNIILPMGEHAQYSILRLFEDRWSPASRSILKKLRSSSFKLRLNNRGRNAISEEYDRNEDFIGLEASLPNGETTFVIPLFHTNIYSNRWVNDYKLLSRAIQRLLD